MTKETVNAPSHYTLLEYEKDGEKIKYEVLDVIRHVLNKNPELSSWQGGLFFNVIKYSLRTGGKDELTQELRKAQFYLNALIKDLDLELQKRKNKESNPLRDHPKNMG